MSCVYMVCAHHVNAALFMSGCWFGHRVPTAKPAGIVASCRSHSCSGRADGRRWRDHVTGGCGIVAAEPTRRLARGRRGRLGCCRSYAGCGCRILAAKPAGRFAGRCGGGCSGRGCRYCGRGRLVQTSPPAGGLACRCPREGRRGRGRGGCRGDLRAVTLEEFPKDTVVTFLLWCTLWHVVVSLDYVRDHIHNLVRSETHTPAFVTYRVIRTHLAGMTGGFQRIASPCAKRVDAIASAHVHRVSRVPKVI